METTNIYTLTDPDTNEVRYVGKSNNIKARYSKHCSVSDKKTHKANWINKLLRENKKPILEILDIVPIEDWVFWEMYWISQMKTWGFNLTNNTIGGDGSTFGNKTSFKKGQSPWNKGIPASDDVKERLRTYNIGKKQSLETIAKRNKSLDGKRYDNSKEFIEGGKKTRFNKDQEPWNKGILGRKLGGLKKAKPVQQFDLEGNLIMEFLSYSEAAEAVNISREMIRRCCIGRVNKTGGFKWKYKDN